MLRTSTLKKMRTLLVSDKLNAGSVRVVDSEAHHGLHVLRLKVGDEIRLCDGCGSYGMAVVSEIGRHSILCDVAEVHLAAETAASSLGVITAAPKGSRFEDMVRSLTELGVGRIQVLESARSNKSVKLDRAKRVSAEALKQCGRSYLPEIGPVVDITTLKVEPGVHMLLDPDGEAIQPGSVKRQELIIGPEGGLSPEEREHLISQGVKPVCLAPHVLRIETAAIAAASVWIAAWESTQRD